MLALRWLALCGWLVLLLLGAAPAAAVEPAPAVRIAYTEFPPYIFTKPDGSADGLVVDIVSRILPAPAYAVGYVRLKNPAEQMELLRTGAIEMTAPLSMTPERDLIGDATRPFYQVDVRIFARRDRSLGDIAELNQLRIADVKGSAAGAAARRAAPQATFVDVDDIPSLAVALLAGTADVTVVAADPMQAFLRQTELADTIAAVGPSLLINKHAFYVSKTKPDLKRILDAGLARFLADDRGAKTLHERWFGRDEQFLDRTNVQVALIAVAAVGLLLVGVGSTAVRANRRAKKSLAEVGSSRLLIDALDGFDVVVSIFDRDLRMVHWSPAFADQFPGPDFAATASFGDIVVRLLHADPGFVTTLQQQLLRSGETEHWLVWPTHDRVFEFVAFRIGADMVAMVGKDVTRFEDRSRVEQARFQATFHNAAVGMAELDTDGAVLRANERFGNLVGMAPGALVGLRFVEFVSAPDRALYLAHATAAHAAPGSDEAVEVRVSDGETERWLRLSLSIIQAVHCPTYAVLIAKDVTQGRRDAERQRLLLGELSHRVKNILTVVQIIVTQTLRQSRTDRDVEKKVYARLRAISAAHDIVFRVERSDLNMLLRAQLNVCLLADASRVSFEGPVVVLPVDLVYSLGLVVHELTTNAIKYGALATEDGRIAVTWRRAGNRIALRWKEHGGPPVSEPTRRGFGRDLITRMIGHAHGGSVRFVFDPDGLVVHVEFDLEEETDDEPTADS